MSEILSCELCSDTGPLTLYAKCHPTAPLRVELLESGVMILSCYIPECNREVGRFKAEEFVHGEWKCGQCGFRLTQKSLNTETGEMGAPTRYDPPSCFECNTVMQPLSWREAALDASKIAKSHMDRALALEAAWPSGFEIPLDPEESYE